MKHKFNQLYLGQFPLVGNQSYIRNPDRFSSTQMTKSPFYVHLLTLSYSESWDVRGILVILNSSIQFLPSFEVWMLLGGLFLGSMPFA